MKCDNCGTELTEYNSNRGKPSEGHVAGNCAQHLLNQLTAERVKREEAERERDTLQADREESLQLLGVINRKFVAERARSATMEAEVQSLLRTTKTALDRSAALQAEVEKFRDWMIRRRAQHASIFSDPANFVIEDGVETEEMIKLRGKDHMLGQTIGMFNHTVGAALSQPAPKEKP